MCDRLMLASVTTGAAAIVGAYATAAAVHYALIKVRRAT